MLTPVKALHPPFLCCKFANMKRLLYTIIGVYLLVSFAACKQRHPYNDQLVRIDSLADVNPDSADQLLKNTPLAIRQGTGGESEVLLLLRIKTDDKLYRPVTQYRDTILQLVDYFEHHRKVLPSLLGKTGFALPYLYAGRIFADLGDAPQALDYYQRALDVQPLTPLHIREGQEGVTRLVKQRGLLYSFIGETMYYQCLYSESVASFQESFHYAGLIKDTLDMIYTLRDIAEQYKFLDSNDSSLLYYKKALSLAVSSHNTKMRNDVMAQIASLYIKTNNFDSAYYYIKPSLQKIDTADITATYSIASKIYKHRGNIDSTLICYNKLLLYGNLDGKYFAHKELSHYYLLHNDTRKAFQHIQSFITYDDTIKAYRNAETVARMHAAYNFQKHEREASQLKISNDRKEKIIIISGLVIALLTMIIYVLVYRNKQNKLRCARQQQLLRELKKNIEKDSGNQNEKFDLQKIALAAIKRTDIYKTFFLLSQTQDRLVKGDEWEEFSQEFNNYFPDFKLKLAGMYNLSTKQYRVCMLRKAGFGTTAICYLACYEKTSIYSIYKRLYYQATGKNGTTADFDKLLNTL